MHEAKVLLMLSDNANVKAKIAQVETQKALLNLGPRSPNLAYTSKNSQDLLDTCQTSSKNPRSMCS